MKCIDLLADHFLDTFLVVVEADQELGRGIMPAALRPYVTTGVVLVGASVIAVTPIAPPQPAAPSANWNVSLAAAVADSATPFAAADADPNVLFNITANLLIALANAPYNFLNAVGAGNVSLGSQPNSGFSFQPGYDGISLSQTKVVGLTANLNYAGNWWVYSPTNVLGTDAADIARYQALTNVAIPFPALSVPLGNALAAIVAALFPMNVGCTGTGLGACPDVVAILSKMFDLRHIADMVLPAGYTFPEVKDPITCDADGKCNILDPNGPETPWSKQNVQLDLSAPFTIFYNSLTATPDFSAIRFPSFQMVVDTVVGLAVGLNVAFNPFVLGTQCGLCALLAPNPEGKPVPGPADATKLDVSSLDVSGVNAAQTADLSPEANDVVAADPVPNSAGPLRTSPQKRTALAEANQEVVTEDVDPSTPVNNTDVTPTTLADVTNVGDDIAPVPRGPKYRKPGGDLAGAMRSVQNTISKVTGGSNGDNTKDHTPRDGETGSGDSTSEGGSANAK